jgi:hypothetical protein
MNTTQLLFQRLTAASPGWDEWTQLITLVKSLSFEHERDEHLGNGYFASAHPLAFGEPSDRPAWPKWLPRYVPALFGLKADDWDMAGGYADSFCNEPAIQGSIFSPAGNDEELGFPLFEVPPGVFSFQSNSSGAQFFINRKLEVLYPNADGECFERLDSLEEFTRTNIRQALKGELWFDAYPDLDGLSLD